MYTKIWIEKKKQNFYLPEATVLSKTLNKTDCTQQYPTKKTFDLIETSL